MSNTQVLAEDAASNSVRHMPQRKQFLRRQERVDAVSSMDEDPPDFLEPVGDQLTPTTSGYSSPATSSRPSPKIERSGGGRCTTNYSDHSAPLTLRRQRQLSAVREQSILVEEGEEEEAQEDSGNLSSDDLYDGALSPDTDVLDKSDCTDPVIGEEECHIVAFTGGKEGKRDELFSGQESNQNTINSFISHRHEYSIDKNFTSSLSFDENNGDPALFSQRKKSLCSLEKISMLPSYSNIHHTSPVTSVDYINNNYGAVPDRMLKHNGPLKEVDQYFDFLNKQSSSLHDSGEGGEDFKMSSQSLDDVQPTTLETPTDKNQENVVKTVDPLVKGDSCDCNGRPTLKCACGRAALQKLLYGKRMIKHSDIGYHLDCGIEEWSPSPAETCDDDKDSQEKKKKNSATKGRELKSILVLNRAVQTGVSRHSKTKTVTFHEDTIFNEGKKSTYVKESVTPGFLCALIDSLDDVDEDGGVDNPVFEDDTNDIKETAFSIETEKRDGKGVENSCLTDDEKYRKKWSFKHPSAKNRNASKSPIALKVRSLVFCLYHLKGIDDVLV